VVRVAAPAEVAGWRSWRRRDGTRRDAPALISRTSNHAVDDRLAGVRIHNDLGLLIGDRRSLSINGRVLRITANPQIHVTLTGRPIADALGTSIEHHEVLVDDLPIRSPNIDLRADRQPTRIGSNDVRVLVGTVAESRGPTAFGVRLLRMLRVEERCGVAGTDRARLIVISVAVAGDIQGIERFSHEILPYSGSVTNQTLVLFRTSVTRRSGTI
jgi:hypothetical protein